MTNKVERKHSNAALLTVHDRSLALCQLGEVMGAIGRSSPWPGHACGLGRSEYEDLDRIVREAVISNGWATEANVRFAFGSWSSAMEKRSVDAWLSGYPELLTASGSRRTVGTILAGNVPLVGLHDVICIWLSGHRARVKCSSQEPDLIPALMRVLDKLAPGTMDQIEFIQGKLGAVDAVIATGSTNSSRYFEYYFGHLPHVIRKSRVSVAVLDGSETEAELVALAEDVFRYFGLGCRNVAKLYLPQDFDLDRLFKAFFDWKDVVEHNKYANNYDYARALWLLDQVVFLENGFILLREEKALASAVGSLHYERYSDAVQLAADLGEHGHSIQCVVGHDEVVLGMDTIPFGSTQRPGPEAYADGLDTLRFLLNLD